MNIEQQKASKIHEELIDYSFCNNANDMDMSLNYCDDQVQICIE